MTGTSKRLRRLVLHGSTYLWKVEHTHHVLPPPPPSRVGEGRCREVFTAYLEGRKASPLRIAFDDGAGHHAGYPARGVVWTSRAGEDDANLNTPRIARLLIERALAAGWRPEESRSPWKVDDGFVLLAAAE
jgi:hypothetical protein